MCNTVAKNEQAMGVILGFLYDPSFSYAFTI